MQLSDFAKYVCDKYEMILKNNSYLKSLFWILAFSILQKYFKIQLW